MNAKINMKETIIPTGTTTVATNSISAIISVGSHGNMVTSQNSVYVDVVDKAIAKVAEIVRENNYEPVDISFADDPNYVLPTGIQTHLTEKYMLQKEINSITFS